LSRFKDLKALTLNGNPFMNPLTTGPTTENYIKLHMKHIKYLEWKAVVRTDEEINRLTSLPELTDTHQRITVDIDSAEKKDESDWPKGVSIDRLKSCHLDKFLKPEQIIEDDEELDLRSLTQLIEDADESEGNKQEFISEVKVILEKELFEKIIEEVDKMDDCIEKMKKDIRGQQNH